VAHSADEYTHACPAPEFSSLWPCGCGWRGLKPRLGARASRQLATLALASSRLASKIDVAGATNVDDN
jgi:hypothetical protein